MIHCFHPHIVFVTRSFVFVFAIIIVIVITFACASFVLVFVVVFFLSEAEMSILSPLSQRQEA
jgi:hypothetical protein